MERGVQERCYLHLEESENNYFYSDTPSLVLHNLPYIGSYDLTVLNKTWTVFLTPKPVLIQALPMMAHRIFLFGGILFAVLDTTNFYIALYDHGTRQLSFPYFVDEQDPRPDPKPLGKRMTEYVMRVGTPGLFKEPDFRALQKQGEIDIIGTPPKLWLGAALHIKDSVIGCIVVKIYDNY